MMGLGLGELSLFSLLMLATGTWLVRVLRRGAERRAHDISAGRGETGPSAALETRNREASLRRAGWPGYLLQGLGVLGLLWGSALIYLESEPILHIVRQEGSSHCSQLGEFCVRVSCMVNNEGSRAGEAVVDLQVLDARGRVALAETQRAELGSGDSKMFVHEFPEALWRADHGYRCVLRH